MGTSDHSSGNPESSPASKTADFPFGSPGWRRVLSCVSGVAALLFIAVTGHGEPIPTDDPRLLELAARLGEALGRRGTLTQAGTKPDVQAHAQVRQQMVNPAEAGARVTLRADNETVLQLRGTALEPLANEATLLDLGGSYERTARNLFAANKGLMRLTDPDNELALSENRRDNLGYRRLRFNQKYRGLPVWPAALNVHFDPAGNLNLVEGAYIPTPELDSIEPAFGGDEAVQRALVALALTDPMKIGDPELIIYGPLDRRPRLAWKLELTQSLTDAWLVVIDAQTGTLLHQSSRVCDTLEQGSGVDLFGANRPLNVWRQGDKYFMVDTSKPSYDPGFDPIQSPRGVITIADAKGASADEVRQTGADIVTSTAANLWNVPAAVSAAFNFSETYDYYLDRHGRNSLDDQGGNITAIVQVGNYDNASWNGNLRIMMFGSVRPYAASLDVVGHELAHGVTETSAGLIYENQSGALSEAFSDIFGELIEARSRGANDWLMGTDLGLIVRNLKNPAALIFGPTGQPYPTKMSEYADLPNTPQTDRGGVHCNSSIINHAFYLLAEGLPEAIGLERAGAIFYRCLTQHLLAQSQFVDCRLGCIAAAEELYGVGSNEARRTAEAFDAVEIFGAPNTPDPTPVPEVPGPDSVLFVYYNLFFDKFDLGRRETALGDDEYGIILADDVVLARPAVTGDGITALFVSPDHDICLVETDDPDSRECLGFPGLVHSVAISPDATLAAFVLRDPETGQPDGQITLLDLAATNIVVYNLVAPSTDGATLDTVLFADAMTFTTDGSTLIYDALSQLKFGNGPTVERWSLYSLQLESGQTSVIVPPQEGIDTANPMAGRAGNRYLAYDARDIATGDSSIVVLDLFTGDSEAVGTVEDGFGYPSFLGDESAVIYTDSDPNAFFTGLSLYKQNLSANRLGTVGEPTIWYEDANLGVIYRRGEFAPSNALPNVTLQTSADTVPAPGNVTLTANATDPDGTIARVEFYNGPLKLGEATAEPYTFDWQGIPAGNYLVIARAIDNLGGAKDSSPRFLTVTGSPPVDKPALDISPLAPEGVRLTVNGPPGYYIISMSEDLESWSDIYPVTVDESRVGTIDDIGGPANFSRLFYRVRREE